MDLTLVPLVPTVPHRDRDFESLPTLELGWADATDGVNNVVLRTHYDRADTPMSRQVVSVNGKSMEFGIGRRAHGEPLRDCRGIQRPSRNAQSYSVIELQCQETTAAQQTSIQGVD